MSDFLNNESDIALLEKKQTLEKDENDFLSLNQNSLLEKQLEAFLFIHNKVVSKQDIIKSLSSADEKLTVVQLENIIDQLNQKYLSNSSIFRIYKELNGYRLHLNHELPDEIFSVFLSKRKKLSKPLLETLTIIAYKQPATRVEIEKIRCVNSSNYIKELLNQKLICVVGYKNLAGQPKMYGTTQKFLDQFSINSLNDLPSLKEVKDYDFLYGDEKEFNHYLKDSKSGKDH